MAYSKLGRNSSQRKALIRDLITDLIINESIETTLRYIDLDDETVAMTHKKYTNF